MSEVQVTEGGIIVAFVRRRWGQGKIMPHYSPPGWWECDICEITEAGYMHEYEIKMSRSDFKRDADKSDRSVKKHTLLAAGERRGPSRFSFIVPKGLVTLDEVPAWAGLIEARAIDKFNVSFSIARAAPRLHGEKCSPGVSRDLLLAGYWRFHRQILDYPREIELIEVLDGGGI